MPLVNPLRKTFPCISSDYLIIHPHFDHYFHEIEIVNEIFIKSKGDKGDWTIESCELDTLEKAKDKILDLKMKKPGIHALLTQLTLRIVDPRILPLILELIDDIKNKKFIID